ncbi:MAG TPA: FtsX-like permease family protein, partial [Acidobacteriota bacterium]|nr:FtsX-like permease family protein [Acidobacteriota bacterium]
AAAVVSRLEEENIVSRVTPRTLAFGMITSPANANSISVIGIRPSTERHLSQIDEAITEGNYFSGDDMHDVVIGRKLAEILEVGLGERVVLTVAQAATGDLSQEMFRISGIFHFNVPEMDRATAFIRLDKSQQLLGLGDRIHEIAIVFTDPKYARDDRDGFWGRYSTDGNEAVGWTVLLPQLEAAFELSEFSTLLVGIMLFGVVALGIVNTLFMSLHERMFEFGVLRAVGTRPRAMGTLILLEAGALAVMSILLGAIIGWLATTVTAHYGIDYTGIEFAGVTFRDPLYPILRFGQFVVYPVWVFLFTVIMGLYPAVFAARMSPVRAMRKSM